MAPRKTAAIRKQKAVVETLASMKTAQLRKPVRRGRLLRKTPVVEMGTDIDAVGPITEETPTGLRAAARHRKEEQKKRNAKAEAKIKGKGNIASGNGKNKTPKVKAPGPLVGYPTGADSDEDMEDPEPTEWLGGYPVCPPGRLPRVGEWPIGKFDKDWGCTEIPDPELPTKEETRKQRVQDLQGLLVSGVHDDEDDLKNIRAIIDHYNRYGAIRPLDPKNDDDYSYWLDGKKITREQAASAGRKTWSEPSLAMLGSPNLLAAAQIIPWPMDDLCLTDEQKAEGVFEAKPLQQYNRNLGHSYSFEGKLAISFHPHDRERNGEPFPPFDPTINAPDITVRRLNTGIATVKVVLDTGSTTGMIGPATARSLEKYYTYIGNTYIAGGTLANGTRSMFIYRKYNYWWLHHGQLQCVTPNRNVWFGCPLDYQTSNVDVLALAGTNILQQDTWLWVRSTPTPDGTYPNENDMPKLLRSINMQNITDVVNSGVMPPNYFR